MPLNCVVRKLFVETVPCILELTGGYPVLVHQGAVPLIIYPVKFGLDVVALRPPKPKLLFYRLPWCNSPSKSVFAPLDIPGTRISANGNASIWNNYQVI